MKKHVSCALFFVISALLLFTSCAAEFESAPDVSRPFTTEDASAAPPLATQEAPAFSQADEDDSDEHPSPAAQVAPTSPQVLDESEPDFESPSVTAEPADYLLFPILTPEEAGDRRLVYNTLFILQVTDFMSKVRAIQNEVADSNGYIVRAEIRGSDMRRSPSARSAEFIFRLPTVRLGEFIAFIENNFNILHMWMEVQEETGAYRQIVWSINDYRDLENILLEQLSELDEDDDRRISLLQQLARVRSSIRELEVAQADIMDTVIYSTITINLSEVLLPAEEAEVSWIKEHYILIAALFALFVFCIIVLIIVIKKRKASKAKTGQAFGEHT